MTKKVPYNLNFLAKSVFELDEEYRKILRFLAIQKEHQIGINQTQITRYFANSEKPLSRKTIHKKLFGANKTMGLIPTEYVAQRLENKKRYGKDETTFHLTFKGLFGALASDVPLQRIYIYKNFLKAVDYFIKDKKINEIIKKYYELQIQSFLLWHYVYGIQLQKTLIFQTYYYELDERIFPHTLDFNIKLNPDIIRSSRQIENTRHEKNKEYVSNIVDIFSSYFMYKGIISLLRKNGLIPTNNDFLKLDPSHESREDFIFDNLIDDWPIYLERFYRAKIFDDAFYDEYEFLYPPNILFLPHRYDDEIDDENISPATPRVRIKPATPRVRIKPATPRVRIKPATPRVRIKPIKSEVKQFKNDDEINDKNNLKKMDEIEKTLNIVYIPQITDKIQKILKEKEIHIDIPKASERAHNVYPF